MARGRFAVAFGFGEVIDGILGELKVVVVEGLDRIGHEVAHLGA